jgi:hypothetical protein
MNAENAADNIAPLLRLRLDFYCVSVRIPQVTNGSFPESVPMCAGSALAARCPSPWDDRGTSALDPPGAGGVCLFIEAKFNADVADRPTGASGDRPLYGIRPMFVRSENC